MPEPTSPGRVRRLPTQLSNQIAAGEVIERPASVAKELVENSLDAGAMQVVVHIEKGGHRLIRVCDDGCGIHPDDLVLALDRHATSKVSTIGDLVELRSLGFRGEALPSIASVSRLKLSSRQRDGNAGWYVQTEAGVLAAPASPAAHPPGTTVAVHDLFYNTPARRRFLRTEKTEFAYIKDAMERLALARFDVGFELFHNGNEIRGLCPADSESLRERRLVAVCGRAFLRHALRLDFEAAGLRLWGWIAEPPFTRGTSDRQYVYVNGRGVRDKLVAHAIRQAYGARLPAGRHPAYALYLEVEPGAVDVNVHPAKHEVRFRDSRLVHDFIFRSMQRVLACSAQAQPMEAPADGQVALTSNAAARRSPTPAIGSDSGAVAEQIASYAALHPPAQAESARGKDPLPAPLLGRALARLHDRYVLAESADGLVVVDIPAATARVTYAQLLAGWRGRSIPSQPLLFPVSLTVAEAMASTAARNAAFLRALGIDLDSIGPAAVIVRQVPELLRGADIVALTRDVLTVLAEGNSARDPKAADRLLRTLARHGGENGAGTQTTAAMDDLLRALERTLEILPADEPRPWVEMGLSELGLSLSGRSRPERVQQVS